MKVWELEWEKLKGMSRNIILELFIHGLYKKLRHRPSPYKPGQGFTKEQEDQHRFLCEENPPHWLPKDRWDENTSKAMVEANGYCVYCHEDLLLTRTAYSAGRKEHLLPKKKYPEFEDCPENHVLSCESCNSLKGTKCVIENGEDPEHMLKTKRTVLIERARKSIEKEIVRNERLWVDIRKKFRGV